MTWPPLTNLPYHSSYLLAKYVAVKTTFTNIPIVNLHIWPIWHALYLLLYRWEWERSLPAHCQRTHGQIMAAHPANSRARTDKWKGVDTSVKKCHVGIRYKQEEGDLAAQVLCESSVKFAGSIQKTTYSRHNLAQSRDSSFPTATSAPSGHDAPSLLYLSTIHNSSFPSPPKPKQVRSKSLLSIQNIF